MKKYSVCILFGGISPEHEVSLRSAESVLNNIDQEKYQVYPVGITREGQWIYFPGKDYSMLPAKTWNTCPGACPAVISPARGQGLLCFEGNTVTAHPIDVVFPVLHGENGEDGAMQGLLQMAGIPYVGPHVSASAVAMDKTLTKLVIDKEGIPQAAWELVRARELAAGEKKILDGLEARFAYPMFVKPAGTGSSVGVSKAGNREALSKALAAAAKYDDKVLVRNSSGARKSRLPSWATKTRWLPSAGRLTPARSFTITMPSTSPIPPVPTFPPGFPKPFRRKSGRRRCGCSVPSAVRA